MGAVHGKLRPRCGCIARVAATGLHRERCRDAAVSLWPPCSKRARDDRTVSRVGSGRSAVHGKLPRTVVSWRRAIAAVRLYRESGRGATGSRAWPRSSRGRGLWPYRSRPGKSRSVALNAMQLYCRNCRDPTVSRWSASAARDASVSGRKNVPKKNRNTQTKKDTENTLKADKHKTYQGSLPSGPRAAGADGTSDDSRGRNGKARAGYGKALGYSPQPC